MVRRDGRPWSWTQFAIAVGLIPIGFLLWIVGLGAAFGPDHSLGFCLLAGPVTGTAGALWAVVLLIRRFLT
jgi:hypothetical protein